MNDDNAVVDAAVVVADVAVAVADAADAAAVVVDAADAAAVVADAADAAADVVVASTDVDAAADVVVASTDVETVAAVAAAAAAVEVEAVADVPATLPPLPPLPQLPQLPQPTPNVKKIVFALPGDNFSSKFLISWTATISKLWETRKYDIMISPATGSFVPFVRMTTLGLDVLRGQDQKPFNGQPFDVWITIDSDIVFTYEQVEKLIEATEEHPVVAGMYRMADLTNYAFVKDWDTSYFKENGTFKFIKPEDIEVWKKETEFKYFSVVYSGMGFMAIRKEVFDNIKYPYFDSEIVTIQADDGTVIRDICSEDVSFCKKITQAGYQIMVNTDIRVGHIKSLVI
jgi:hypothetical protein